MNNLLSIPLRQTSETDLYDQLKSVIDREFFQSLSQFEDDCRAFSALRQAVTRLSSRDTKLLTVADCDRVQDYYIALEGLRMKFPDDFATFSWYGTLGYALLGPYEYNSISLEQLNVIYQLGAIYSQLALHESRYTGAGLKLACTYYQLAAGCFALIRRRLDAHTQTLVVDLHVTTIDALRYISEAQAQEMIWQRSVLDEMRDSIVARLAMSVATLYEKAETFGASNASALTLEWINHIRIKMFHFRASADYRMAAVSLDAFEYGEQVAHLQRAHDIVREAKRKNVTKHVSALVVQDFLGLSESIEERLRVAEKDNDLIYLKPVPLRGDLQTIAKVSMVKGLVPERLETLPTGSLLLFQDLFPFMIIQVAQAYRERQDTFFREQLVQPIESLNKMVRTFLGERNLPAIIDSIQKPECIPDSIVEHSQEIIANGGLQSIESAFDELNVLAAKAYKLYEGGCERLRIEHDEDELLRQRHGNQQWNRIESSDASKVLRDKLDKMKIYIRQAGEGDEFIKGKYLQLKPYLELLCGGYASISRFVPNSVHVDLDPKVNRLVADLRTTLTEFDSVIHDRKKFVAAVEVKSKSHNILEKIVKEYKAVHAHNSSEPVNELTFENTYRLHILLFNDDLEYIDRTKAQQMALESQVEKLYQLLQQEMLETYQGTRSQRASALQTLESAYASYIDLVSNLNEGIKFYNEYMTKSNNVLHLCDEYVSQRRLEGRDMEYVIVNSQEREETGANDTQQAVGSSLKSPQARTWDPSRGIKFE